MTSVQVRDLVVELGGARILDGVGATFAGSSLTAVAGPNGSGKTTLLRTLVGITHPAAGSVTLTGPGGSRDLPGMPPRDRALLLAMVGQDAPVTSLRVRDVVALGRLPHRRWFEEVDVAPFLERAGVSHLADRDVATLSGGERQRVHVARALAQEPAWLVLDEPTNHLDLAAQREVLTLARDLTRDGVSVVAALHDLNHVLAFADHVVVLRAGRVHAEGVPDDVLRPDLVREVWGAAVESVATTRGRRLV